MLTHNSFPLQWIFFPIQNFDHLSLYCIKHTQIHGWATVIFIIYVTINIPITLYNTTLFILILLQPLPFIKVIVVSVAFEINITHPLQKNNTVKRRTSRLREAPFLLQASKETVDKERDGPYIRCQPSVTILWFPKPKIWLDVANPNFKCTRRYVFLLTFSLPLPPHFKMAFVFVKILCSKGSSACLVKLGCFHTSTFCAHTGLIDVRVWFVWIMWTPFSELYPSPPKTWRSGVRFMWTPVRFAADIVLYRRSAPLLMTYDAL